MVAKNGLSQAASEIEKGLQSLPDAGDRVRVLVTDLGHIHAFVGSDRFKGLGPGERQQEVWEYLRDKVDGRYLEFLFRVLPMDVEEFTEFMREVQLRALSDDPFGDN